MSQLVLHDTPIGGLQVIERCLITDSRGYFERLFCQDTLGFLLKDKSIRQINHTLTKNGGAVRGLHFQHMPHAEIKIVTCLKGKVWDVAVDLRKGSPTFLHYHAVLLSQENQQSYLIPEGFAHGFQALSNDCEMLYLHTADYSEIFQYSLNAVDPRLAIAWPRLITERSERDLNHPMVTDDFQGVDLL